MKLSLALAALAAFVATAAAQDEPTCASTELNKLAPIAKATSTYQTCKAAVPGFTLFPVSGAPNTTQWQQICNTPSCSSAAGEIRSITTLLDCKIANTAKNVTFNVYRFAKNYDQLCFTYTPAPPTPAPTTVAPTPAPTTVAPQPTCASTELNKLAPIAKATSTYQTCKAAVPGFTLFPVSGAPNTTQWQQICNTPSCSSAAGEIRSITTLLDCEIANTAKNVTFNVYRFAKNYDQLCFTYTPAPPTPAPTTVAPTPEPTVPVKPSC